MHDPWFFGYGSLVNRATHDYAEAHPATLKGWRRVWRHTGLRPLAFLTVEPADGAEVDGLVARVPGGDWAALDARERAYDRVPANDIDHPLGHAPEIAVYTIPEGKHAPASEAHPVLLSYIDTVAQGFLAEFGEDGLGRFFETTHGWDAPVLNDRSNPIYPRHQRLTQDETALVDVWLASLGVRPRAPRTAPRPADPPRRAGRFSTKICALPATGDASPPIVARLGHPAIFRRKIACPRCRQPAGGFCSSGMTSAMSGPRSRPVTARRSGMNRDLPLRPVAALTAAVHSPQVSGP